MTRHRNALQKAVSLTLAAVMSLSSVTSSFASETTEISTESVEETGDNAQETAAETVPASEADDAAAGSETDAPAENNTEAASTDTQTDTDEDETEGTDSYILLLPVIEGASYSGLDSSKEDPDLSTSSYKVFLYEEGENVSFTVSSEMEFSVINADSREAFIKAEDIANGSVSFVMPAADLAVQFIEPEDQEENKEADTEEQTPVSSGTEEAPVQESTDSQERTDQTDTEETEAVTEQTEATSETEAGTEPETENVEETASEQEAAELPENTEASESTEAIIHDETEEAESQDISESETDTENIVPAETEEADQTESSEETEYSFDAEKARENLISSIKLDIESNHPSIGSTDEMKQITIWAYDSEFDLTEYVKENYEYYGNDVDMELSGNAIDTSVPGSYTETWKFTLKNDGDGVYDDGSYYWFCSLPVIVVDNKDNADEGSDNLSQLMFNRQDSSYTGLVPSVIGSTVDDGEMTITKGSDVSAWELNPGYDTYWYGISVEDDGGFDPNTIGTYHVKYQIHDNIDPDMYFYADVTVNVVEAQETYVGKTTVRVNFKYFTAAVEKEDGSVETATYGNDVKADFVKSITISSDLIDGEIKPAVEAQKDGDADDSLIVSTETGEDNKVVVSLGEQSQDNEYLIVIGWPDYNFENAPAKTSGGIDMQAYLDENYDGMSVSEYYSVANKTVSESHAEGTEKEDLFSSDSARELNASETLYTFSGQYGYAVGTSTAHNYNPVGTGYNAYRVTLSSSWRTRVLEKLEDLNAEEKKGSKLQGSFNLGCITGHSGAAPSNSGFNINVTTRFIDTDNDGIPNRVVVSSSWSNGVSGYQSFAGSKSFPVTENPGGYIRVTKRSTSKNFIKKYSWMTLYTTFSIYDDKRCREKDTVDTLVLNPAEEDSTYSRDKSIELDPGTYYVKETGHVAGHAWVNDVFPVKVKSGETTYVVRVPDGAFTDEQTPAANSFYDEPLYFNGQILSKVGSQDGLPVANAVFEVTVTVYDSSTDTFYLRTDSEGKLFFTPDYAADGYTQGDWSKYYINPKLGYGVPSRTTITMKEVASPEHYALDPETHSLVVYPDEAVTDTCLNSVVSPAVSVDKQQAHVNITKKAEDGVTVDNVYYSLEGAEFTVTNADTGEYIGTVTTDANGQASAILDGDTRYNFTETKAPTGFNAAEMQTLQVDWDGNYSLTFIESAKKGSVSFSKQLGQDESSTLRAMRDLTNCAFRLTKSDGTTIYEIHPDKSGNVKVDNLTLGHWELSEDRSVDIYHKPMEGTVPFDVTSDNPDVVLNNVDFNLINYRFTEWLIVVKKDADTGSYISLGHMKYQIIDEAGELVSLSVDGGEKTTEFITDEDGVTIFDDKLPGGKYTLHEIDAPASYYKTDDITFEVTEDGTEDDPLTITVSDSQKWGSAQIIKKDADTGDSAGAGFVFHIVADQDVKDGGGKVRYAKDSIVDTITTGDDGKATSKAKLYMNANGESASYHFEEVSAPAGYKVNKNDIVTFEINDSNADQGKTPVTKEAKTGQDPMAMDDQPSKGKIKIVKKDAISENGAGKGAVFNVIAKDVKDGQGHKRKGYEAGTVVDTLTIGDDFTATSKELYIGTYMVKESRRANGFELNTEEFTVEVKDEANGTTENVVTLNVVEQPITRKITLSKNDSDSQTSAGAGFTFDIHASNVVDSTGVERKGFEKDAVVDTITTGDDGKAVSNVDLYMGDYYIIETGAPSGYQVNKNRKEFSITDSDAEKGEDPIRVNLELSMEDKPSKGKIQIVKKDAHSENGGGAGAVFDIIAKEVKDGGGTVRKGYEEGTVMDTLTIGDDFTATSKELYIGTYTVKESRRANGFELNTEEFTVEVKDEANGTTENVVTLDVVEQPITRKITLSKNDSDSQTSAGAGFTFDIHASNVVDSTGVERKGFEKDAVVDTITTDDDGKAVSNVDLYMGDYYIVETGAPSGYQVNKNRKEFSITDSDAGKGEEPIRVNLELSMEDKPSKGKIQIVKKDAHSENGGGTGAVFDIIAKEVKDGGGAVRKGYEEGTVVDTLTIGDDFTAVSRELYIGTYTVKETQRAKDFLLNTKEFTVEITDKANGTTENISTLTVEEIPLQKAVSVTKVDAKTGNHCGAGYEFEIHAVSVVDSTGETRKGYEEEALIDTITTDDDGIAVSPQNLYVGDYYIVETAVSEDGGMSINRTKYPFSIIDETDEEGTPLAEDKLTMIIPLDDIADYPTELKISKVGYDNKEGKFIKSAIEGVTFRIKEKDAADADTQLYKTDANGSISVDYLLHGKTYTIQETETIPGYNLNTEVYEFTVDEYGLIDGSRTYSIEISNIPNVVKISKTDVTTGKELPGASLKITDVDGNVVDEWVSEETPHVIYEMPAGTYRLTETIAPDGYEVEESAEFTVVDSDTITQKVEMHDSPYREVEISKTDIASGDEVPGCTLTIKDAANNVIDTWESTNEPHTLNLHSGVYTLTEDKPADGYVTSDTITFEVVKTTADDYTAKKVEMVDDVTKITVSKKDITNGEELPGAKLQIKDSDGNVVDEWISTDQPHYIERLPIGTYTLTEITAPYGYEVAETITFEVLDTGEIQHYEMFDSPYREMEISKLNLTGDEEVIGAHLQVIDSEGNVVEEWDSEKEAHKFILPHGKYTLVETKPADGYVTAESVQFEVIERNKEGDLDVQHVDMFDDVTKVEISKQDVADNKELPGAKLKITDSNGNIVEEWTSADKPHYIEKLPIGKYTLTEVTAPDGYDVAESVEFEVIDTDQIQHVVMYDSQTQKQVDRPKTGDDLNVTLIVLIVVIIAALLGFGVFFVKRGKKKDNSQ